MRSGLAKVCRALPFWIQQAFFYSFLFSERQNCISAACPSALTSSWVVKGTHYLRREDSEEPTRSSGFQNVDVKNSKYLPLPSNRTKAVTFFLESFSSSGLKFPTATAIGIGAHISGHEVFLKHPPMFAQNVFQPMDHTGGSVAGSLLGIDTDLQDGERRDSLLVGFWSLEPTQWDLFKEIVALQHTT